MNIARSRIAELEGLKEMNINMLKDIYGEKRVIEKLNHEIQEKLDKKDTGPTAA